MVWPLDIQSLTVHSKFNGVSLVTTWKQLDFEVATLIVSPIYLE